MQSKIDPRRVLSAPTAYRALQNIVGGERAWRSYIEREARISGGERILDLGCGPGHILEWLPDVDYHGLDIEEGYIEQARRRFGDRASFHARAIDADATADLGKFDIVLATGVLHHLDDQTAHDLFRCALASLKPGGTLVTCDGVKGEPGNPIAKWLVSMDRGEHVRQRSGYEALAREFFDEVEVSVRRDLSRLPYLHCVMRCQAPASA